MTDETSAEGDHPGDAPSLAQEVADLVADAVHPDEELRGFGKVPFNYALIFVAVLTLIGIGLDVALSVTIDHPTPGESHLLTTCDWIVKSGIGAFLGLVLGKSTR